MKLKLMFMFCLAFSIMMVNKLQAQSITFTGPTFVNGGQEIELTAVGETYNYHIVNMPTTGAADDTPFTGTIGCALTYQAFYDVSLPTPKPSKIRYKIVNTSDYPRDVKITFSGATVYNTATSERYNVNFTYNLGVGPRPTPVSFANSAQSGSFVKDDCVNSGGPGPAVVYTVPAGKYQAASQAAADALAVADVNANGQPYANLNGTCATEIKFTLFVPSSPNDNGDYPQGSKAVASISFISGQAPAGGVKFEIEVRSPDQTIKVYEESSVRIALQQLGGYSFRGRITKLSTGEVGQWLSNFVSVSN